MGKQIRITNKNSQQIKAIKSDLNLDLLTESKLANLAIESGIKPLRKKLSKLAKMV